jgi:predicted PurR-regulated permease PerM
MSVDPNEPAVPAAEDARAADEARADVRARVADDVRAEDDARPDADVRPAEDAAPARLDDGGDLPSPSPAPLLPESALPEPFVPDTASDADAAREGPAGDPDAVATPLPSSTSSPGPGARLLPDADLGAGDDDAPQEGRAALTIIALVLGLSACWLARDLLVPVMLAMMLALLANPIVTRLNKLWIPRWLGALAVVLGGLALSVWLGSLLVGPATDWVKQAPTEMRQLAPKLKALTRQVDQANKAAESIAKAAGANVASTRAAAEADKPRPPNLWSLISGAPAVLASIGAVVLLSYFFLVYGHSLQRHAIARLDGSERKIVTIDILRTIEADLSRYVLTISFINVVVGMLLAGGLVWMGLDLTDALLWGTLAALLNYIPYVGPLSGVLLMGVVGVVAFDKPLEMATPAMLYLGLHAVESQFVTPVILGRRMAISPLVMLLWLMLWGFLWGVAGLLLAVPMLASLKIVAERVERWQGWAKVIE